MIFNASTSNFKHFISLLLVFTSDVFIGGLFLGDIGPEINSQDIKNAFQQFGPVDNVDIKTDKRTKVRLGYGFVYFFTSDPVEKVIGQTDSIAWIFSLF